VRAARLCMSARGLDDGELACWLLSVTNVVLYRFLMRWACFAVENEEEGDLGVDCFQVYKAARAKACPDSSYRLQSHGRHKSHILCPSLAADVCGRRYVVSCTYGTYHIQRRKVPRSVCPGASTGMDGISTSDIIQRSRKPGFSRPDAICTCHDTGQASFRNAVLKAHGRGARCALRVRKSREARISAVGAILVDMSGCSHSSGGD